MSDNPFARPASASGIQWDDHKGRLLLVEPKAFETGISTTFGDKDAVRADVTIIDAPGAPVEFVDTLIFPGALIGQTRSLIGKQVLGRLGQGQAKPGQKPPWRLDDPTADDVEIGKKYLAHRQQKNPFASPANEGGTPPF
jgi:hypothetical protein